MIRARAFVTFAVSASFLIGLALCAPRVAVAQHRSNELTLAGLRPGRDTLDAAVKKLGKPLGSSELPGTAGEAVWTASCSRSTVTIEVNPSDLIQTITLQAGSLLPGDCYRTTDRYHWVATGHGIRLGDLKAKVISVYGKPGSVSPSTKDGRELELLYYAFDWAGPDVPQVMEITCERATGRVVEIMLAFPSL